MEGLTARIKLGGLWIAFCPEFVNGIAETKFKIKVKQEAYKNLPNCFGGRETWAYEILNIFQFNRLTCIRK